MKKLILENDLPPKYLNMRIQTDILIDVNFSRLCESRSKNLFKLHKLKTIPKYNKIHKKIYG
jgi:hypothetical protein